MTQISPDSSGSAHNSSPLSDGVLAAASALLLLLYLIVAYGRGFFALPAFDYRLDKVTHLLFIPPEQLSSMFWKITLLFPAACGIAVLLTRAGIRTTFWESPASKWRVALSVVVMLAVVATFALVVLQRTEVTDDEIVYTFQAKTLLQGRLTNPPPPGKENFDNVFMINDGTQWIGHYNGGHPLWLALGMVLGSPYVTTFLSSALLVLLVFLIGRQLFGDPRVGFLASSLLIVSPFFTMTCASLLSHSTAAVMLSIFVLAFLSGMEGQDLTLKRIAAGLVAGLALGYGFNIRPLTAMAFAAPFGLSVILSGRMRERRMLAWLASVTAGFAVVFGLTLLWNRAITGHALLFPIPYLDAGQSVGLGVQDHTLAKGFSNLAVNIARLNAFAFGFPISLLFVAVTLFIKWRRADWLLWGILASLSVAYLFWWSAGVADLGPVYYFEAMIPIALLTAHGVFSLTASVTHRWPQMKYVAYNFLLVNIVLSILIFTPERIGHLRALTSQIREPYELMRQEGVDNAVVFVSSLPLKGWVFGYRTASPTLDDSIIMCRFLKRQNNDRVLQAFPDRTYYVLRYNPEWVRSELRRVTAGELLAISPQ